MADSTREIIFDTETTGLDFRHDRVIEIGGVEMVNRFPTGRTFHVYIHPEDRDIHPEAEAVHGISKSSLAGKPKFREVADEFAAFIDGARLVAHNATFDIAFINAEFERIGFAPILSDRVIDSLAIARRKHPMGPNSLDALCRRYGVDNSHRTKHGALLDSELLAEVYIELTGGRQAALLLDTAVDFGAVDAGGGGAVIRIAPRPRPLAPRLSDADIAAHDALVRGLGEAALWRAIDPAFPGSNHAAAVSLG
ncbi:MAG: DNA polymerase III subunit epsilon [Rhizobiaceae bacterium]